MTVSVICGDSRDVLKTLGDETVDSVVCDPPYALVSIGKRFGTDGAAPPSSDGATGVYKRAAAGFMGQKWDTGETAFAVEFWAEVMRVLKPGGHVVAFSGTRTYHRLAVAIEDAGFEIRDMISWLYGSGFPKSHDVSKGIDKKRDDRPAVLRITTAMCDAAESLGSKHPTVKPVDLMRWLCRLVTPPGGLIVDPFAGSGTTGVAALAEGFDAILIEREKEFADDARRRISWAMGEAAHTSSLVRKPAPRPRADDDLF